MAVKRFWTFVLIFLGIFCEEVFSATDDKCIWLDKCGPHPDYSNKCLNCYREKPAEKLANHDIYKKLYEACPHFRFVFNISFPFHNCTECSQRNYWLAFRVFNPGEDPAVCCSEAQIDDLLNNFGQAKAFLGRCPTCYYNFRMNFCDMTCRPNQNKFLKPEVISGNYSKECGHPNEGKIKALAFCLEFDALIRQRILQTWHFFRRTTSRTSQKCYLLHEWWF